MIALITLNGLPGIDKPKNLMNIQCKSEAQLIDKLKELQSGYSLDGKDKPRIDRHNVPSKQYPGKSRKVIDCSTYSDWHHIAHINVSSPSVQTETIN